MCATLIDLGHDVLSALERNPNATDEELLTLALTEQRILITEDKDFGELIFAHGLPHPCIIRLINMPVAEKAATIKELIEQHSDAMHNGALIVATQSRVRIRHRE
jgi:predicted nuclease of predicted toxin-antitoxin system